VSYFRPQKARKTGPRSIPRFPNSTQKMSQEGGRVMCPQLYATECRFLARQLLARLIVLFVPGAPVYPVSCTDASNNLREAPSGLKWLERG
jgi:hypothetical protein